jgi:hypothetical protein
MDDKTTTPPTTPGAKETGFRLIYGAGQQLENTILRQELKNDRILKYLWCWWSSIPTFSQGSQTRIGIKIQEETVPMMMMMI